MESRKNNVLVKHLKFIRNGITKCFSLLLTSLNNILKSWKQPFEKVFIVYIPNFIILAFGIALLGNKFSNMSEDTTNFTNIGFAILSGLSILCFTWASTFDKDEIRREKIRNFGENSLHAAVLFLIASTVKYISLNHSIFGLNLFLDIKIINSFISSLLFFLIIAALYKTTYVLFNINRMLYERIGLK